MCQLKLARSGAGGSHRRCVTQGRRKSCREGRRETQGNEGEELLSLNLNGNERASTHGRANRPDVLQHRADDSSPGSCIKEDCRVVVDASGGPTPDPLSAIGEYSGLSAIESESANGVHASSAACKGGGHGRTSDLIGATRRDP